MSGLLTRALSLLRVALGSVQDPTPYHVANARAERKEERSEEQSEARRFFADRVAMREGVRLAQNAYEILVSASAHAVL